MRQPYAIAGAALLLAGPAHALHAAPTVFSTRTYTTASAPLMLARDTRDAPAAACVTALEKELSEVRAEAWAARCEAHDLRESLEAAQAQITALQEHDSNESNESDESDVESESEGDSTDSKAMPIFDAIDDNGDGVLTREEFTKGYALFMAEQASNSFDAIDDNGPCPRLGNRAAVVDASHLDPCLHLAIRSHVQLPTSSSLAGDGVLTRDEFSKGFAILTSDSARAAAEREKVERAVAMERVRATKEAALILAEAELRDVLDAPSPKAAAKRAGNSQKRAGSGPKPRVGSSDPYKPYGRLPQGFDAMRVQALVDERCEAKAKKNYAKADVLQEEIVKMGVRLDDRWRTWSCEVSGRVVPATKAPGGGGRGRGKRISPGERRWREGARGAGRKDRPASAATATATAASNGQ